MNLEIRCIWSPNLDPPSTGLPENPDDYDLFMQVHLGEKNQRGEEVFGFRLCSRSALAQTESGTFVSHTLVLEPFDWTELTNRLKKLIRHADSCADWECVLGKFAGLLQYSDE